MLAGKLKSLFARIGRKHAEAFAPQLAHKQIMDGCVFVYY